MMQRFFKLCICLRVSFVLLQFTHTAINTAMIGLNIFAHVASSFKFHPPISLMMESILALRLLPSAMSSMSVAFTCLMSIASRLSSCST